MGSEMCIRDSYDLIKPTRCLVEEKQRYLKIQQEDETVYVAYFTINSIVGELDFPSSEIFYYQQQQFTFPIDTSMNVEIVANRKALSTVRNKKKELKDLDNHAWQSDNETSSNVAEALELSLIHLSEPTRRTPISYAVFCLKKKKKNLQTQQKI